MVYQLAEGVNLHVLPTKQYKTIRIFIRFTARLQQEVITKRSLLSSMLETNSLNYPDQTKLSAKSEYDANIAAGKVAKSVYNATISTIDSNIASLKAKIKAVRIVTKKQI